MLKNEFQLFSNILSWKWREPNKLTILISQSVKNVHQVYEFFVGILFLLNICLLYCNDVENCLAIV